MSAKFPRGGGGAGPFLARSLIPLLLYSYIYIFYHMNLFMNLKWKFRIYKSDSVLMYNGKMLKTYILDYINDALKMIE